MQIYQKQLYFELKIINFLQKIIRGKLVNFRCNGILNSPKTKLMLLKITTSVI